MSKYKLKDHVTDEMLIACGFEIVKNSWGYKWAIRDYFTCITLHNYGDDYRVIRKLQTLEDDTPVSKDLIELGYVEEMN